jgi:hypothetical protein
MTFKVKRNPDNTYKIVQSWVKKLGQIWTILARFWLKILTQTKYLIFVGTLPGNM